MQGAPFLTMFHSYISLVHQNAGLCDNGSIAQSGDRVFVFLGCVATSLSAHSRTSFTVHCPLTIQLL